MNLERCWDLRDFDWSNGITWAQPRTGSLILPPELGELGFLCRPLLVCFHVKGIFSSHVSLITAHELGLFVCSVL